MHLPDVNVWLALTFDSHVHHPAAKSWFEALSGELCFFCRMTQQGFLRLASNQKVFGVHALTLQDAWKKYDLFRSDVCVSYMDEPADVELRWRRLTQTRSYSPHVWNDAFLGAFAQAADLTLISFDKGFANYADLNCRVLT